MIMICRFCNRKFEAPPKIEGRAEQIYCSKKCKVYQNNLKWLLKRQDELRKENQNASIRETK